MKMFGYICFIYKFILPTNSANSLPLIVENRIRPMAAPNFDRSFSPSFKSDFSSTPIDDFAQRMVWIQFLGLYFSLGSANWREMGYTQGRTRIFWRRGVGLECLNIISFRRGARKVKNFLHHMEVNLVCWGGSFYRKSNYLTARRRRAQNRKFWDFWLKFCLKLLNFSENIRLRWR